MSNLTNPKEVIEKFFEKTTACEVSQMMNELLSNYLEHSEEERIELANKTSLAFGVQRILFILEKNISVLFLILIIAT